MRTKRFLTSFVLILVLLVGLGWLLGTAIQTVKASTGVEQAVFRLYQPSFMKGLYNSSVYLQNPTDNKATVELEFFAQDATLPYVSTLLEISPKETIIVSADDLQELPYGPGYGLVISSDQPVQSVNKIFYSDTDGDKLASFRGVSTATTSQSFGPFYKEWESDQMNSGLVILNADVSEATVNVEFLSLNGASILTETLNIPPFGQRSLFSINLDQLPDGFQGWTRVMSDQPVVGQLHQTSMVYRSFQINSFLTDAGIPRILKFVDEGNGVRSTMLFVGNTANTDANTTLNYLDSDGTVVYSSSLSLPALGGTVIDLANETNLPETGTWAVTLDGDPSVVIGESYQGESGAVSVGTYEAAENTELSLPRLVKSDKGHTVFSVQRVDGGPSSVPVSISYYNVTGTLVFNDDVTLAPNGWARFDLSEMSELNDSFEGSAILASSASLLARVDEYMYDPNEKPDLSFSHKSVSLSNVENGDHLTYTLILRNRSAVTASATLTDPIPAHTIYIPGSAQASDGNPVTLVDDALQWAGQVISGTPVVLEFAVEVQQATVGQVITNVAHLDDGAGTVLLLEADAMYNPGYRLTVDEGALYTSVPTVTLSLSWGAEEPPIEKMQISNDGGFGSGTGWVAVDSSYSGWVLDTYGDLRMPRTVYALFHDTEGRQYGPIQDDIVYDPQPPQPPQVEIITQMMQVAKLMGDQDVVVRVTAVDDNSGISEVQISHSEDFQSPSIFDFTGKRMDISWTLQSSGKVYVRVVDRAGNVSEVESEQGPLHYEIYLPAVLRVWQN